MPPVIQPIPRFIADASQEALPYGRWAEVLSEHFRAACKKIDELPADAAEPVEIDWFPERGWGGRFYVPALARAKRGEAEIEYFGQVSFRRGDGEEPTDFAASADFTDVLAEDNPDWKIDVNDDVIGSWRGEVDRSGEVVLVWGRPLVQGADAATAELDGSAADQTPVMDGRFTLIAVDAVDGFGDKLYLEIHLWNKRNQLLAAESLYDSE
ncbi:MAG: hypothetical protein QOG09_1147 [Solirubrobacterales bacterium]|jgi:hypothetical protein|nr:hypothetical protein [Solirubrobacterales bacterium]MDX6663045.1 hypothetical protein [Solirubrobacterales bacterium]